MKTILNKKGELKMENIIIKGKITATSKKQDGKFKRIRNNTRYK